MRGAEVRSARQVRLVAPSSSRPLRFINFLISHAGREWVPGVFSSARSFAACVARFTYGVRQLAQSGLQNQIRPEHHRDAVPVFFSDECRSFVRGTQREGAWLLESHASLCGTSFILQGRQEERQRPHKPSTRGFDPRPCDQFSFGPRKARNSFVLFRVFRGPKLRR